MKSWVISAFFSLFIPKYSLRINTQIKLIWHLYAMNSKIIITHGWIRWWFAGYKNHKISSILPHEIEAQRLQGLILHTCVHEFRKISVVPIIFAFESHFAWDTDNTLKESHFAHEQNGTQYMRRQISGSIRKIRRLVGSKSKVENTVDFDEKSN